MSCFDEIYLQACQNKNGEAALKALMPNVINDSTLKTVGNDRYLAEMTRCVFQAGFVWRIVNQKWNDFESVFFGFSPEKVVLLSPEQLERLGRDKRIIRSMQKINTVPRNARFILNVSNQYGSFGNLMANWPCDDLVGLFAYLKKHGSRLGGMTGQRVLRNMGKDTFIITPDVVRTLQSVGLDIRETPSSQRELALIQQTFNEWHRDSGLPYSHLSRICACAAGP